MNTQYIRRMTGILLCALVLLIGLSIPALAETADIEFYERSWNGSSLITQTRTETATRLTSSETRFSREAGTMSRAP